MLDARAGVELWLKAENLQHSGAFKARGAMHAVGRLCERGERRGVVAFSSGNHGQAVAFAARAYGVPATIVIPIDAPAIKVAGVRRFGGNVVFAGLTSDDRRTAALEIAARTGAAVLHPFDDPEIIAGAGTATLEFHDQVAAATGGGCLDALLIPVGGGGLLAEPSGVAGLAAVLGKALPSSARRVGVVISGGNVEPQVVARLLGEYGPRIV